jgi:hypothetical protein
MADLLEDRLDRFARRHPRLMLVSTVLLGVITTLILIYYSKDTAIVYRAF